MNTIINNKIIKKKLIKTNPTNYLDENERLEIPASGHSLQKPQQQPQQENDKRVIKKKQKSKRKSENKDKKSAKKKLKQKENQLPNTDIANGGIDIGTTSFQVLDPDLVLKNDHIQKENSIKSTNSERSSFKLKTTLQERNQDPQDIEYYHEKVYMFMKSIKHDYKRLAIIYNCCLKSEQERQKRNEEEINELQKIYNQLQVERTEIKRKRWCRYCECEATYLCAKGINFYCSLECEEKQNDLVSVMEDIF